MPKLIGYIGVIIVKVLREREVKENKMNPKSILLKFFLLITLMLLSIFTSCVKSPTLQITASGPINTEAQAIQVASQYVPAEIATKAIISASDGKYSSQSSTYKEWIVDFSGISVTKSDLGWQADDKTVMGDEEPYTNIQINLNGVTGELVFREAVIPVNWVNQTPNNTETEISEDQTTILPPGTLSQIDIAS